MEVGNCKGRGGREGWKKEGKEGRRDEVGEKERGGGGRFRCKKTIPVEGASPPEDSCSERRKYAA